MIGRVRGTLLEMHPPQVLLDVQGLGYEIDVPMSTFYDLPATGSEVILYTHLLIREDAHLLFGFATESERRIFRQLLRISGIGARTALALLSGLSVGELYDAVNTQDSTYLVRVPGIGKKTAERLLLELRDRLDAVLPAVGCVRSSSTESNDIYNALLSLGYSDREVDKVVKQIPVNISVSDGIRMALQWLSKSN